MIALRPCFAVLVAPAFVLALAACGGGGGGDSDKITKILKDGGKDPASICDHLAAPLLGQFGGVAACKKAAGAQDIKDPKVDVKSVDVTAGKAIAKIVGRQGPQQVSFVKEGGEWKVTATR